jgi:predicted phosphoribosyltransferase
LAIENKLNLLRAEADIVEVIISPSSSSFRIVEQYYQNYDPINHEELIGLCEKEICWCRYKI